MVGDTARQFVGAGYKAETSNASNQTKTITRKKQTIRSATELAPNQPREGTVTLTRAANGASPNGGLATVAAATEEARQGP